MSKSIYRSRLTNGYWHPSCMCGWKGRPMATSMAAKKLHADHVREDCPIGDRRGG